jgi:hypothetical protein
MYWSKALFGIAFGLLLMVFFEVHLGCKASNWMLLDGFDMRKAPKKASD